MKLYTHVSLVLAVVATFLDLWLLGEQCSACAIHTRAVKEEAERDEQSN